MNSWESRYVFNTASLYLDNKVHLLYRAIGDAGLSVLGYASSRDGVHIDERLNEPVYICPAPLIYRNGLQRFSSYASGGSWTGCEDPRLTKIDNTIYMTYTLFKHWENPPCVAMTSIAVNDFLNRRWHWQTPKLISPPNEMHKNFVIFSEKINGKYALLHSVSPKLLIDFYKSLDFTQNSYVKSCYHPSGRLNYWDNCMRGVGPPPIKIPEGWLVLYHAMDKNDPNRYKIGAMIVHPTDPSIVLYRSAVPLIQPDARYENEGHKAGVVYSCGAIILDKRLFVYYGGADTVVCVASIELNELINQLKNG